MHGEAGVTGTRWPISRASVGELHERFVHIGELAACSSPLVPRWFPPLVRRLMMQRECKSERRT